MTEERPIWKATVFGPGAWVAIHVTAIKSVTPAKREFFCDFIRDLTSSLPCEDCRKHAVKYVKDFPPERYLEEKDGLFRWSWIFHNAVNRRLGKPEVAYDTAYKIYATDDQVCRTDCGEPEKTIIAPPPLAPAPIIGVSASKSYDAQVVYVPTFNNGLLSKQQRVHIAPRNH